MAKKKKQSKLQKVLNVLNPTTPKKGLLLFAVVFAVIGGGFMAYKSFAASAIKPPSSLTHNVGVAPIVATDGYQAQLFCNNTTSSTSYGKATPCYQVKTSTEGIGRSWVAGKTEFRSGVYNLTLGQFIPSSSTWSKYDSNMSTPVVCSNMNYYFMSSNVVVRTNYGPVTYGQIYRPTIYGTWQVAWVRYSPITKQCTSPGS